MYEALTIQKGLKQDARHYYAMHHIKQSKIIKHYTGKLFFVLKRQYQNFIKVVEDHGVKHARTTIDDIIRPTLI